jgi:predicted nucleotide-binding protein (sugar kinase/HSP70/actin superfamily)
MEHPIIVPPDPGLMGAYGVSLEVARQMENGQIEPAVFDLDRLICRDALREGNFVCSGGTEKCDRKCSIARLRLDGEIYPFGGICNRYYNLRRHREIPAGDLDLVEIRQRMLFEEFGIPKTTEQAADGKRPPTVGIMRSFLTHSLYPLYSHFFDQMGCFVVLSDGIDREGTAQTEAEFCLPAEIAHGSFYNLLLKQPDFIFVPQVMQVPVPNVPTYSRACVFVQGEPYYLKTTFRHEIERRGIRILNPVLRMDTSYEAGRSPMLGMAMEMGIDEERARKAFEFACRRQRAFDDKLIAAGTAALEQLKKDPDKFAVVLFGRPYNSFTGDANMGIPHRFASRDTLIIPFDMLPAAHHKVDKKMFWAMGQKIMKAAQFVKDHRNLFGCYITNFSCGPDSFLLGYFRRVMGEKPSLTLELDQHTADTGVDTRIEAALSIMSNYHKRTVPLPKVTTFRAAKVLYGDSIQVVSSLGRKLPLTHPDVEVVLPSMGRYGTEGVAAVMRSMGINARALPISDKDVLLEGRSNTSCKECLPYILTTGSFMRYIRQRSDTWKVTLFFLATGGGPCRLGQYCVALDHLIQDSRIENAAVLTLTDENGYGGMGSRILLRAWQALVVSDVIGDILSTLMVAAENREEASMELEQVWKELLIWFEGKLSVRLSTLLATMAQRLRKIPLRRLPESLPVVSLIGEIYVRRDEFSRKDIVDYLEKYGFVVRIAPIGEYPSYGNYVVNTGLGERQFTFRERVKIQLVARIQEWWESRIKSLLSQSGLYHYEMIDVANTIGGIRHLLNENFRGETILTVGLGMREILNDSCGIISIGPFGCMPSRMAEAMLKKEMDAAGKGRMPGWSKKVKYYRDLGTFPFLSIETDGTPFPQLVEANLEAFILQAERLYKKMSEHRQIRERNRTWRHLPVTIYEMVLGNGISGKRVRIKTGTKS